MKPLLATTVDILQIRSFTKEERELSEFVENWITKVNSSLRRVRVGDSLVVFSDIRVDRPTIGLAGHLDTVPGSGFGKDVTVDAEKIVGLGSSDMKGGVAIMMELLRPEVLSQSSVNTVFIFYAREEGPNRENELRDVLKALPELKKIDLCFFLEPTDGMIQLGACGSLGCEVTIPGVRAHSARPWHGVNAIHRAAEIISAVAASPIKEVTVGKLVFKEVVSVTKVSAGIACNVIPDECSLYINARSAPGTTEAEVKKKVLGFLPNDAQVAFTDWNPFGTVPYENECYKKFQRQFSLEEHPKQAYTDVAMFSEAGIDSVNFGPGLTAQAHQNGEFLPISLLESVHDKLLKFLTQGW